MQSRIYDFLDESILFDRKRFASGYRAVPYPELRRALRSYGEYVRSAQSILESEARAGDSALRVFSARNHTPVRLLLQGGLYFDRFIANDPLYWMARWDRLYGSEADTEVESFKPVLHENVQFLRNVRPLDLAGYLKLIPVSERYVPPPVVSGRPRTGGA